jgi:glycosyltransferase involved in cell wall biosynthesis
MDNIDVEKLLIVTDVTVSGGTDKYIINTIRAIHVKRPSIVITVLMDSFGGSNNLYESLLSENIRIYRESIYIKSNSAENIQLITQNVIQNVKPDIVLAICGSPRSCIVPRRTTIDANIPLFFVEQYVDPNFIFTAWQYDSIKYIYERASGVVVLCKENKFLLEKKYKFYSKNMMIIPNSIFFTKKFQRKKIGPNKICRIVCLGRLTYQKGFDILVEGVELLENNIKEKIVFYIYGDGPDKEMLEDKVRQYSLQKQFVFMGWVNNASEFLGKYDLFLMPSRYEGQPFALMEAIYQGVPCIATNVSGIPEVLDFGKNGDIIQAENRGEIARSITDFVKNPNRLSDKTKQAFDFVRKNHNIMINIDKLFNLWNVNKIDGIAIAICTIHPDLAIRALNSIQKFSAKDRIIVVVDGRKYLHIDLVNYVKNNKNIVLVINEENRNLSYDRNIAIQNAKSNYIIFFDDDVILHENVVSKYKMYFGLGYDIVGGPLQLPVGYPKPPGWLPVGLSALYGIHTNQKKIWGGNFGFNVSKSKTLSFQENLGRKGRQLQSGDDTLFIQQYCKSNGVLPFFSEDLAVFHCINLNRFKLGYLVRRYFWQGRSEIRRNSFLSGFKKEFLRSFNVFSKNSSLLLVIVKSIVGLAFFTTYLFGCFYELINKTVLSCMKVKK